MATTLDVITDRVRSLLVNSLGFTEAQTPFSFELQPTGNIDGCVRVEDRNQRVVGGFKYSEERTDQLIVWVAKKLNGDPREAKRILTRQMHSITSAIVWDGHAVSGEYSVTDDGRSHQMQSPNGAEYAVLQIVVPVNYETELIT
jgi:hypothetical protein